MGVFAFSVPEQATIIGFGDDLIVIVMAKHPEDVKVYATETVKPQLDFADEKTGATLITNR